MKNAVGEAFLAHSFQGGSSRHNGIRQTAEIWSYSEGRVIGTKDIWNTPSQKWFSLYIYVFYSSRKILKRVVK